MSHLVQTEHGLASRDDVAVEARDDRELPDLPRSMVPVFRMDRETIEAFADAVVRKQELVRSPIINLERAMELSLQKTPRAFYRWCKKHHVTQCGHGRYSREKIVNALHREASRAA
jgi:hypothetical protein